MISHSLCHPFLKKFCDSDHQTWILNGYPPDRVPTFINDHVVDIENGRCIHCSWGGRRAYTHVRQPGHHCVDGTQIWCVLNRYCLSGFSISPICFKFVQFQNESSLPTSIFQGIWWGYLSFGGSSTHIMNVFTVCCILSLFSWFQGLNECPDFPVPMGAVAPDPEPSNGNASTTEGQTYPGWAFGG